MKLTDSIDFADLILQQFTWTSMIQDFKTRRFHIKLLETQKNFKHQTIELLIQIFQQNQKIRYYKSFKTSDLPSQAITIFYDVENLYQYLVENYKDNTKILFNSQKSVLVIVNNVVMKNKQIKQQIQLDLTKEQGYQKYNSNHVNIKNKNKNKEEEEYNFNLKMNNYLNDGNQELSYSGFSQIQKPIDNHNDSTMINSYIKNSVISDRQNQFVNSKSIEKNNLFESKISQNNHIKINNINNNQNNIKSMKKQNKIDHHPTLIDSFIKQQDSSFDNLMNNREFVQSIINQQNLLNSNGSKLFLQSLIKQQNSFLQQKVQLLTLNIKQIVGQILKLKSQKQIMNQDISHIYLQVKNILHSNMIQKQKQIQQNKQFLNNHYKFQQNHQIYDKIKQIQKKIQQNRWNIQQINYSYQSFKQSVQEDIKKINMNKSNIKKQDEIIKNDMAILSVINNIKLQLKDEIKILNKNLIDLSQYTNRFGQKIHINIDTFSNKYIQNFILSQAKTIQKIKGDEQRHQILGYQNINYWSMRKKYYFQVKIISSTNSNILIGVITDQRKYQRYSYDNKQCVCYDGKGFIFEQGIKSKMPWKFQNNMIVRVVVNTFDSVIQWFVGYTEIASVTIPEYMRKLKLVPYFEFYDVKDKVALN